MWEPIMRYMLLIYGDEAAWENLKPEQIAEVMGAYYSYTDALRASGKLVSGDELQPISTAKTVKVGGGKTNVVDGPYVDTKESLGGYYLIDVDSEAEAVEWAAKCPGSHYGGGIEVRPVMVR
jgi:hypothetical protein